MGKAGMKDLSMNSLFLFLFHMEFQKIAFKKNNGEVVETFMPEDKAGKFIELLGPSKCWTLD